MRLASRILVVVAVAVGPAVVAVIGCGIDTAANLPGLPNEIPNTPGGGVGTVSASEGSSSSSTSTGITTTPALTPCDCAASLVVTGSPCSACAIATETDQCLTQFDSCTGGCNTTLQTLTTCDGGALCINQAITGNTAYEQLLLCQCNACLASCGQATPIACEISLDGGMSG
jgi:hypothetical protein